jgi:RHH-type proline utilization regulon transcriptional repressor/proline dehydrogenase/delta 1-pyrroline-5-carboxylate dehydrogenase
VLGLADRALRPEDVATAAAQLRSLVAGSIDPGQMESLSPADAWLLRLAARAAPHAPFPVVSAVGARLRYETRGLIYPAEPRSLGRALARLGTVGYRANLNLLGEAVLGDAEAARRLSALAVLLSRPDVTCASVKVSAVAAGLCLLDTDGSVSRVTGPLQDLYRIAAACRPQKLVNLDMEEHRDLDITVGAFTRALAASELADLTAGIALQAYLPDSHAALERVLAFAKARTGSGGAPVRVRLVKGANLAMERATAELASWPQAPYATKAETDASYKAMLERLIGAARKGVAQVGVASHNLFDIAFALVLAEEMGVQVEIEMLAGMADQQAAAIAERTGSVLLYTPVVMRRDYRNALAYLARRLDENTTPEGFLRHALEMVPGSPAWGEQAARFAESVRSRHEVSISRPQRRLTGGFAHEPATDLSLPAKRRWAHALLGQRLSPAAAPYGGEEGAAAVELALSRARRAGPTWDSSGAAARGELLARAGDVMASGRAAAISVMAGEGGKTFEEADPEVSEAVDYARWYGTGPGSLERLTASLDVALESRPLGSVVVAPPWNFPYAIPAGGTLAALAAGNAVILKPAPEAPLSSRLLASQLHEAGIPDDVLQLLPIADGEAGRRLVSAAEGVVLTGSYATATLFGSWAPSRRLLAETSGKNAIVVSAAADVDQAVHDIVASAFGHAGQKCSAASLAIVVAPLYDKGPFLRQLRDAVRSLRTGPASDPATQVGPIVGPFTEALERALTRLDPGESWLVEPRPRERPSSEAGAAPEGPALVGSGRLWSPGVRLGVRPGSWAHLTEWFGPVLGVMRAASLDQAFEWQNAVAYGLTAGFSSLDPDEHRRFAERAEAGNLYINRVTTGAIVGRQPFGGWKRSSYGPTAKAGGPSYLVGLRRWRDAEPAGASVDEALSSYRRWWEGEFAVRRELAGLTSESNELRYRPFTPGVVVRSSGEVVPGALQKALALSKLTGTPVTFSLGTGSLGTGSLGTGSLGTGSPGTGSPGTGSPGRRSGTRQLGGASMRVESDESFAAWLRSLGAGTVGGGAGGPSPGRLRLLGDASQDVLAAAIEAGLSVLDEPICSCGRIELVRWLREQVVTRSLHRYGNVVYSRW